jgi:hypothetical protein
LHNFWSGGFDGKQEKLAEKLAEERRKRDAPPQEGHAQKRLGQEGDVEEAGDRDRIVGSAGEGRKRAVEEVVGEEIVFEKVDLEQEVFVEEEVGSSQ